MKKWAKRLFFVGIFLCICTFVFAVSYIGVAYVSSPIKFNKTKITDSNLMLSIYDASNKPLNHTYIKGDFISLKLIPKHTIDAFISIEDKEFYNHNGINYKRIISAIANNIKSFSFKEGASTISQQLIKNTHLTNEKTIIRKINEIKLTKKLESEFTKNEILEYYLNIIYFGDDCYGIQNASEHYFSHSASNLTLDESATLAGMIKSPNKFHPVKNYTECLKRRNLVLSEMKKDGKISNQEYIIAKEKTTEINLSDLEKMDAYTKSASLEAQEILKMPEKQIAIGGYKIYTYLSPTKQKALNSIDDSNLQCDMAMISINKTTGGIEAYNEKSTIPLINVKRQPASTIKPTLVYAPAINENIISPCSQILDDKISINGYTPKNIGDKYNGYVSAQYALSNSLNIPAVKTLSYVGVNKAKAYLERQGIQFEPKDDSLALALGGMTYGLTLKDLTNTYLTLANGGNFIKAKFIKYIVDSNGKIIYKNSERESKVYRDDTAYLVTSMLQETAKTGTAKRLSNLPFDVASKTGTSSRNGENIDAYNISYTSEDIIGCWFGDTANKGISYVGGGIPTAYVKSYLQTIYKSKKPGKFNMPTSVVEKEIDTNALENQHTVYLAGDYLPQRYRQKELFSRFNLPTTNHMDKLTITAPKLKGKVQNGVAMLNFFANEYETYDIYIKVGNNEKLLDSLVFKSGETIYTYSMPRKQQVNFYIKTKVKNYKTNNEIESDKSNEICLYCP